MNANNKASYDAYRPIDEFGLFDLDLAALILQGESVLEWTRLNLAQNDAEGLCRNHGLDLDNPADIALVERIRDEAIAYLSESFDFPVPGPIRKASLVELLQIAASAKSRHRQFCACTLLKAMHVINHFDASEARQALKVTDQELFLQAEGTIYQTISQMMADRLPVVEFMGGRKQRASMVTKLLSKSDPLSAQLFDKMRFRVVTATRDDVLPVMSFLCRRIFPFNYVLGGESYNTLFHLNEYLEETPHLSTLSRQQELNQTFDSDLQPMNNIHSSPKYKVVHWVADMPVRIPNFENAFTTDGVNPIPRPLIYVRAEIQILDRKTHRLNERGHASHRRYKARQLNSVSARLKVGNARTSRIPE